MSKFSLSELSAIFADKNAMSQTDAESFIRQMFDVAHQAIQRDKQLKIKWLGTFKITAVKDRESIDVNTGERIVIEGRDKMTFTPDNVLKDIVNKPFAQFETVVVNDGVDFSAIDKKFSQSVDENAVSYVSEPSEELSVDDKQEANPPVETVEPLDEEKVPAEEIVESLHNDEIPSEEIKKPMVEIPEAKESVIEPRAETVTEKVSSIEEVAEPEPESTISEEVAEQQAEEIVKPVIDVINKAEDEGKEMNKHYFMLPRYTLPIAIVVILCLMGGIGWFAFSYGQLEAQRNHLSMQLADLQKNKQQVAKKQKPTQQVSEEAQKAKQDSIRMVQASKVLDQVEKQEVAQKSKEDSLKNVSKAKAKSSVAQTKKIESTNRSAEYDADVRVRTGAYRITGIAQTVEVKKGQTLEKISSLYLGPGMECYMEAVNGSKELKPGQKVKIPKLELKKKR